MKQHLVPYSRVDVIAVERKATAALAFVVDHFLLLPIGVLIVVSLAASAGFTFALFFATAIMPAGPLLGELKLGALSTAAGALVALAAARLLRVGRFTATQAGKPIRRLARLHI
jgi:hypothetical protein